MIDKVTQYEEWANNEEECGIHPIFMEGYLNAKHKPEKQTFSLKTWFADNAGILKALTVIASSVIASLFI